MTYYEQCSLSTWPEQFQTITAVIIDISLIIIIIIIIITIIIMRCSVLVQRFNAVLLHNSLPASDCMD